jgi:radical SAM protein with 4Fe4S-binding SPASM domain
MLFIKKWLKDCNSCSRFYFWGGEPLLYWETIKQHILMFESEGIYPKQYRIFSNGLLLNDEITDFCNKHSVLFTMSYDAPNPLAVRSAIPSQENINALLKCRKRSVNFVFNALNCDPVHGFTMLEEMFPETIVDMGLINLLSDIPKDIYTFKEGQIDQALSELADEIIAGNDPYGNRYNFFLEKFYIHDIFNKDTFKIYPYPPCAPGFTSISFKFNGDIVRCHNDNQVIASIDDTYEEIRNKHGQIWKDLIPDKCYNCSVLPICRNRCPIGLFTKDKTEYVHCDVLRQIYGSVIKNMQRLKDCEIKEYKDLRSILRQQL